MSLGAEVGLTRGELMRRSMVTNKQQVPKRENRGARWQSFMFYGASKVAPGLIMIAAVPIWTRTYGASEYGLYSITWAAALFSSSFFTGWLRQAILRHTGNRNLTLQSLPRWVTPICSAVSTLPVVVVVLLQPSPHTGSELDVFLWTSVVFAFLNSAYTVSQAKSQRENEVVRYTIAEIVRIGCALLLSLTVTSSLPIAGSVAIVGAYSIGTLMGIGVLTFHAKKEPESSIQASHVLQQFWAYGWPLAIWLTVSSMLLYVDRILIGMILGSAAAGTYAAISDLIVRGIGMLTFPITMTAHPEIMRRWNTHDKAGALTAIRVYTKYLLLISAGVVVIGAIFGTRLLQWFLGVEIPNPVIVPALLAGGALWQVALMTHKPLEIANKTMAMLITIVIVTACCIALNLMLIPVIGLIAPPVVFFLGALGYVVATTILSVRTTRVQNDRVLKERS